MVAKAKKQKDNAEQSAAVTVNKRTLSSKVYTVTYGGVSCLIRATTPAQAVAKYKRRLDKPNFEVRLTSGEELFAAGRNGLEILDDEPKADDGQAQMFGKDFVDSIEPSAQEIADAQAHAA